MKPHYLKVFALAFVALGMGSLFQNCSNARFEPDTAYNLDTNNSNSNSISSTGNPVSPGNPGNPVNSSVSVICDPFDKKNIVDPKMGVEGRIYSAGNRLNSAGCAGGVCTSRDYIAMGSKINAALFMNRIFVPTRVFTEGFGDGDKVTDANNNVLFEWFALDLVSKFVLEASDDEGMYQFAVISDDGATLSMNGQDSIVSEGEHPPALACASQVTVMKKTDEVPFRLTYFQGPRQQISLVLLMRKVSAGQSLTDCGTSDGKFADATRLPAPLAAKGWKVVKPGNLKLSSGKNLCAPI